MIFKENIACEDCGENPAITLFKTLKLCESCFNKRSYKQKIIRDGEKIKERRIKNGNC